MWICSKYGFFSIVKKTDGYHVRTRKYDDLATVLYQLGMSEMDIQTDDRADYKYRAIISDYGIIRRLFTEFSLSIDYPNFKGQIATNEYNQREKLGPYTAFHHDMAKYQDKN